MVAGQRRWRRERRRLTGSTWCRLQWGTSFESIILDRSFRAIPLPRKQTIDGAKLGPGNELRIACRQSGPRDQYQRADPDGCNNKRCDQSIAEPSPTSIQQTPATLLPRVAVLLFFVSCRCPHPRPSRSLSPSAGSKAGPRPLCLLFPPPAMSLYRDSLPSV